MDSVIFFFTTPLNPMWKIKDRQLYCWHFTSRWKDDLTSLEHHVLEWQQIHRSACWSDSWKSNAMVQWSTSDGQKPEKESSYNESHSSRVSRWGIVYDNNYYNTAQGLYLTIRRLARGFCNSWLMAKPWVNNQEFNWIAT